MLSGTMSADSCTGLTWNCLGQCGLQAWVSAVCRGVKPCPMPSCLAVTPLGTQDLISEAQEMGQKRGLCAF